MSVDVWRRGCGSGYGLWLWSDPRHSFSRPHTPTLLRVDSTKQGKGAAFDASRGVVLSWSHIQFEVDVKVKVPGGGPCKKVRVWFVSLAQRQTNPSQTCAHHRNVNPPLNTPLMFFLPHKHTR